MGKIRLLYVLFGISTKDLERIKDVYRGTTVIYKYSDKSKSIVFEAVIRFGMFIYDIRVSHIRSLLTELISQGTNEDILWNSDKSKVSRNDSNILTLLPLPWVN
jgi:hypothetical protein